MRIIVVGGGAAGLVSAIFSSNQKNDVTILEKNNICGKKILATGAGRCNYYNDNQDLGNYYSNSKILFYITNPKYFLNDIDMLQTKFDKFMISEFDKYS